jgi:hypothetical protein
MKIAMLTSDYLPSIGGIASHIYELSKALIVNGHQVEVWLWDRKGTVSSNDNLGDIPVRLIKREASKEKLENAKKIAQKTTGFFSEFKPDVIHVHTLDQLMPALAFLKKKFPFFTAVWTNHTSRFLRNIDSLMWRFKMRYYLRGIDGLVATCKERRQKSLGLGVPSGNCLFIPNGVDPDKFEKISKDKARDIIGVEKDAFLLLYTGRFAPIKGVSYLAQAIKLVAEKIPDLVCVMCGNMDGDRESEKIREFIRDNELEKHIRLEGFIKNNLLGPYLSACDSLVLPSLMEATSISMLEAMTVGRPVIGSRVGGIAETVIEKETGILVRPADSEDLARGIMDFWEMDNRELMGVNAKKHIEEFTWRNIALKTAEFYRGLIVSK